MKSLPTGSLELFVEPPRGVRGLPNPSRRTMNGNVPAASSEAVPVASPAETPRETVEYVGIRVDGGAVVLDLSEHRQLSPDRSLDVVNHSPNGFEWGYTGSGPAQLACGLLLDYYGDEQFAREHYIAFLNRVVSRLECEGPADCWHLTGKEIDAALATITDDIVAVTDGGQPAPSLPPNWRTVTRPDRRVFQRNDFDHYIVFGVGDDEWLVLLCSQGDRAYPAPLASQTVPVDGNVEQAVRDLAAESNDLIEPPEEEH